MVKELIYIVEDDPHIQQLIKFNLDSYGYRPVTFDSAEDLLGAGQSETPDLYVLDIMLPGIDGLELCKMIRKDPQVKHVPILLLTAKGEEFDKILGLELGADDYMVKPFSVKEFVARVKALIRRSAINSANEEEVYSCRDLVLNTSRRTVFKGGNPVDLSYKEFELLKLFLSNKGRVLSRETLLERIWGYDYFGETRTVDVHIRYLRMKLGDDDNDYPKYINTVRGIGYRFNDD
ncbi:MAG: response regulator transcription factor [Oscillospiraceae bacterium]|nr:response regulator transcription factor [Oscillospiraceae bacterium]